MGGFPSDAYVVSPSEVAMTNSVPQTTEQAPSQTPIGVWVFFATTLLVSTAVVYVIGNEWTTPMLRSWPS
jgi:hypothetical protein